MDERKRNRASVITTLIQAGWNPPIPTDVQTKHLLDNIQRIHPNATLVLAPREREILGLTARGHTRNEIAGMLGISPETVKRLSSNARQKLGARNTAHAIALAIEANAIVLD